MTAFDVLDELKADPRTRAIPVIIVTSHVLERRRARAACRARPRPSSPRRTCRASSPSTASATRCARRRGDAPMPTAERPVTSRPRRRSSTSTTSERRRYMIARHAAQGWLRGGRRSTASTRCGWPRERPRPGRARRAAAGHRRLRGLPAAASAPTPRAVAGAAHVGDVRHHREKVGASRAAPTVTCAQPFEAEELIATVRSLLRLKRGRGASCGAAPRSWPRPTGARTSSSPCSRTSCATRWPPSARRRAARRARARAAERSSERARAVVRRQVRHLAPPGRRPARRRPGDPRQDRAAPRALCSARSAAAPPGDHWAEDSTAGPSGPELTASAAPLAGSSSDKVRLEQAFTNLIDNASSYTPEVEIGVELDIEVPGDAPEAVLTVREPGRASRSKSSRTYSSRSTRRIRRTPAPAAASASGSRWCARSSSCTADWSSARSDGAGRGSEFEIRLPALPEVAHAAIADSRPSALSRRRTARHSRTVLIVEDNVDAREMLEALCKRWGYHVETAENGPDGSREPSPCCRRGARRHRPAGHRRLRSGAPAARRATHGASS